MGGITAGSNNLIGDTTTRPYSVKQTDPLAHLTTPPDGPSQPYDKNTPMLQPGTYSDMQIKANHTFAPGIYTIDGGSLKVAAQYNLSGSGVIFVLKNGATIVINGGSNISRSEDHTSELQSPLCTPSAVFCLKKSTKLINS